MKNYNADFNTVDNKDFTISSLDGILRYVYEATNINDTIDGDCSRTRVL